MRKQIDIPDELIKDLKLLAVYADKSVKKYMEDVIVANVKDNAKKARK